MRSSRIQRARREVGLSFEILLTYLIYSVGEILYGFGLVWIPDRQFTICKPIWFLFSFSESYFQSFNLISNILHALCPQREGFVWLAFNNKVRSKYKPNFTKTCSEKF